MLVAFQQQNPVYRCAFSKQQWKRSSTASFDSLHTLSPRMGMHKTKSMIRTVQNCFHTSRIIFHNSFSILILSFFSVNKKKFLLWGGHNCLLFRNSFKTLICYSVYKESCKIVENLWSWATWLVPVNNITWHASPLPMYQLCYCTQTDSQTDIQKHSDWPLCAIEKPNEDPRELLTWSPHCTPCTLLDPARCICHPNAPPNPCTATILFKRQPNTRTFFFTKQAQHTHQRNFLQAAERWSSSSHGFDTPNTKWKNHTFGTLSPWGNSKP